MTGTGPHAPAGGEDFLSGSHGQVIGRRATVRALLTDALSDARAAITLLGPRLRRAAATAPQREVLALAVERPEVPGLLTQARAELERSHHHVRFCSRPAMGAGKFENLNTLLESCPAEGHDWLIVIDDDVALPSGFLDRFLFLAERFELQLAQPAHRARSHAAWAVTRRQRGSVVRETAFVEIGPVFALRASAFAELLPFPPLRSGWGLDLHWSALARRHGWRLGIIDATPIRHGLRQIAASYDRREAVAEARAFLSGRPYTPASEVARPLAVHRRWSRSR